MHCSAELTSAVELSTQEVQISYSIKGHLELPVASPRNSEAWYATLHIANLPFSKLSMNLG